MIFSKKLALGLVLVLGVVWGVRADEPLFQEPADGLYTEKQLTGYLDCTREFVKLQDVAGQAAKNASGMGALAIAGRTNQKFQAILAEHGMSMDEWLWVGGKTWEAYMVLVWEQTEAKMKAELQEGLKKNNEQLAAAQAKLATYEDAQKKGIRVLSPEDRQHEVERAKEQVASLTEELRQAEAELKEKAGEIAQHEAAAKQADELASKPPADITDPDERESYIGERKSEAESERQAITDARDQQKDQQAHADELKAQLTAARQKAEHPEVPQTDEEKEQIKQDNESTIASTRQQVEQLQEASKLLAESNEQGLKQYEENRPNAPAQNVELLRKHLADFAQIWKIELPQEQGK